MFTLFRGLFQRQFTYWLAAPAIVCSFALVTNGHVAVKLTPHQASELRGTQILTYVSCWDCYCAPDVQCQNDGCGGAWPMEHCSHHENRLKVAGTGDNWCTGETGIGKMCYESYDWNTCSTVSGTCEKRRVGLDEPPAYSCLMVDATGFHMAPIDCYTVIP